MAGAGPLTCHVSCVHTLAYPTVRRNIRYLFIRRVHFVLHTIHTIQSHSAGLSLPPCLRARGVYIAWRGAAWGGGGLARPRDPDPGAAAATNGRQPRSGPGTLRRWRGEGWNVENFYILLDEEEIMYEWFFILFCPFYCRVLSSAVWSDMFPKTILFRWTRTSAIWCRQTTSPSRWRPTY